jgi:hypothetical protein
VGSSDQGTTQAVRGEGERARDVYARRRLSSARAPAFLAVEVCVLNLNRGHPRAFARADRDSRVFVRAGQRMMTSSIGYGDLVRVNHGIRAGGRSRRHPERKSYGDRL